MACLDTSYLLRWSTHDDRHDLRRGNGGTGDDHTEALRALEQIDSEVGGAGGGGAADALDRNQLCEQYRRLKPLLQTAIRLVQAIPVYGPRIASAIRFLMTIADQVCPG